MNYFLVPIINRIWGFPKAFGLVSGMELEVWDINVNKVRVEDNSGWVKAVEAFLRGRTNVILFVLYT